MRVTKTLVAAAVALLIPLAAAAQSTFTATLTGDAVVPGPGSTEGSGLAVLTFGETSVTYTLLTADLGTISGAHIHQGAAGASGGVVIDLAATFSGGTATGTVSADAALIDQILAAPANYSVQVHTGAFPNGAIRGQLAGAAGAQAELYFPVLAAIAGEQGTFFRSDVRVVNFSGTTATVTFDYFPEGPAGNAAPAATFATVVMANEELVLDDVVASELGVSNGKGAVRVTSDAEVAAMARIYNDQRSLGLGTFGQYVRAVDMDAAYAAGALPFLSSQPAGAGLGFRSNIGWFNPSADPVTVTLRGYSAAGALLGEVQRTVAGYAQQQQGVDVLWPALATADDFYVTYHTDGAGLLVYASVVDNVNGDAIYVPAVPLS